MNIRMTSTVAALVATAAMCVPPLAAQEKKPVPKDSARVSVLGCTKGYVFTAAPRTTDEPGSGVPEGMHLRMNGPKAMMSEIKAHEGSMIEITGLMKKGQFIDGVNLGGGVRMSGASPTSNGMAPSPGGGQNMIDVEGWRPVSGACKT